MNIPLLLIAIIMLAGAGYAINGGDSKLPTWVWITAASAVIILGIFAFMDYLPAKKEDNQK